MEKYPTNNKRQKHVHRTIHINILFSLLSYLSVANQYPRCSAHMHCFYCPTWKCTNLAMLGSAMNIWCSKQQMRHCTSLRSLSKPPSISASSGFLLPFAPRLPSFDLTDAGPLMLVSRVSLVAPSCCSSEVGRQTSNRIWTAALSWR